MSEQSYLESLFGQRGRTAVVTGATSGLGTAVAGALGRVGAHVVVVGRDAERGRDVVARIEADGGSAELELVDVCDEAEVVALAERVRARRSSVDVLVNAAGIYEQLTLNEVEKRHIFQTLQHTNWNKSQTALILQIERSTLDRKIKSYDLKRP